MLTFRSVRSDRIAYCENPECGGYLWIKVFNGNLNTTNLVIRKLLNRMRDLTVLIVVRRNGMVPLPAQSIYLHPAPQMSF